MCVFVAIMRLPRAFGSRNDKPRITKIATPSTNSRNDDSLLGAVVAIPKLPCVVSNFCNGDVVVLSFVVK